MSELKFKETEKFTSERLGEIEEVRKEHGLTPENLVEKARSKESKTHDLFEWDNTVAGEEYRRYQARILINQVEILYENGFVRPAYENVYIIKEEQKNVKAEETDLPREYVPLPDVINDKHLYDQMIEEGYKDLVTWRKKYSIYKCKKFESIIKLISKLEEKWQNKKQ